MNIEFFFLIMNDDKIFFKIIMLILISNNFHLWIEELKDLILKIKIWKYINSYDKIEESRKKILSKISHFVVKSIWFRIINSCWRFYYKSNWLICARFHTISSRKIFSWNDDSATRKLSNKCEKMQAKKEINRENHSKNV